LLYDARLQPKVAKTVGLPVRAESGLNEVIAAIAALCTTTVDLEMQGAWRCIMDTAEFNV